MALKLITPAPYDPVSLAEAKEHLNVNFNDHDAIIGSYITAATDSAQQFTGRAFINQTWELVHDSFPTSEIKIPLPPLIEVVSVKYDDTDGNEQTVDPANYYVDDANQPGWIVPIASVGWPATLNAINAVRIQYRAGYQSVTSPAATDAVPFSIKQAILMTLGTFYLQRETIVIGQAVMLVPAAAESMLRAYRVEKGMA